MTALQKILACFALLLTQSTTRASPTENYTRSWLITDDEDSTLREENIIGHYQSLLYAARSSQNWTVFIKKPSPSSDSVTDTRSCTVTLLSTKDKEDGYIPELISLQRLNEDADEVIFTWLVNRRAEDRQFIDVTIEILRMSDCQNRQVITQNVDNRYMYTAKPYVFKDSIEIISSDTKVCGKKMDGCRVSFNKLGMQIEQPEPFPFDSVPQGLKDLPISAKLLPKSPDTVSQGFYLYGVNDAIFRVVHIDATGKLKLLLMRKVDENTIINPRSTSTSHNLFGLCWVTKKDPRKAYIRNTIETTQSCVQFDERGKIRLNVTLKLHEGIIGVHNLADGGMLIATMKDWYDKAVRLIDADGFVGKSLELEVEHFTVRCVVFSSNNFNTVAISESDNEYDFYFTCLNYKDGKVLNGLSYKIDILHVLKTYVNDQSLN